MTAAHANTGANGRRFTKQARARPNSERSRSYSHNKDQRAIEEADGCVDASTCSKYLHPRTRLHRNDREPI